MHPLVAAVHAPCNTRYFLPASAGLLADGTVHVAYAFYPWHQRFIIVYDVVDG